MRGNPHRRWLVLAAASSFVSAAAASTARAHDFLLRPNAFRINNGDPITLALLIGHNQDRARWQTDPRRILRLDGISESGAKSYLDDVAARPTDADHILQLADSGTHVLLFESSHARSELQADRFEAYLALEGLTPAQEARQHDGRSAEPGRELYSRRAKALIQVGPHAARDASHVVAPHGQTLEIVTEANPYALAVGEQLPVRVYYRDDPLSGALVKLWDLNGDAAPTAQARTDETGRILFTRPPAGEWQLGVVWTRPLPPTEWAQFETVFASLTFGVG